MKINWKEGSLHYSCFQLAHILATSGQVGRNMLGGIHPLQSAWVRTDASKDRGQS